MGLFSGISDIVGGLTGGIIGDSPTEKASKNAKKAAQRAYGTGSTEVNAAWEDVSSWLKPYMDAGTEALTAYKQALGVAPDTPVFDSFNFDASKITENPAYQFIRDQGLQAVDRAAAKNRNLGSGNRLTAIADYMSGLASTEYDKEWQRQKGATEYSNALKSATYGINSDKYNNRINNLGYLTSSGQNAATNASRFRTGKAQDIYNMAAGYAADKTAADLLPAQEKTGLYSDIRAFFGLGAGAK